MLGQNLQNVVGQIMDFYLAKTYKKVLPKTPIDNITFPCEYVQLDITDNDSVFNTIFGIVPDVVIHCAAWTAVDAAEDNKEKVMQINSQGTKNIASVCQKLGCKMMYISTDYVFDGEGDEPWMPDCRYFKSLNVYGESKL